MHEGMFFKFALDFKGLYGGTEFSMKAANHERKGTQVHPAELLSWGSIVLCVLRESPSQRETNGCLCLDSVLSSLMV